MHLIEGCQNVKDCGDFMHPIQYPIWSVTAIYGIQAINRNGENLHTNVTFQFEQQLFGKSGNSEPKWFNLKQINFGFSLAESKVRNII